MWSLIRPRDNFIAVGCGIEKTGNLQIFHPGAASNTFNLEFAKEITNQQAFQVTDSVSVPLSSLQEIIENHVANSTLPFLLDIDIEGMDYEILSSYNFPVGFRPKIILIEDKPPIGVSVHSLLIQNYLIARDYQPIARTIATAVYVDQNSDLWS